MAEEQTTELNLRVHWQTLVDFRWLIAGVTVLIGTAVIVWTMGLPRIYEAETTIEYDPNPQQALGQDVTGNDPLSGFWSAREYFATQNRIIRSQTIAERVVRTLGLQNDPSFYDPDGVGTTPDVADLAQRLRASLSVGQIKDTRLVRLTVRDRSPTRAKAIADAFFDVYLEKTMADRMSSTVGALEWLGTQLEDLRGELEDSELALHAFKQEHNVLSVSMEDRQNLVAGEIEALSTALTESRRRRIEASARVSRLRAALRDDVIGGGDTVFDERSGLVFLRQALRERLAEKERLGTRYGAAHPLVLDLERAIATIREQLTTETQTIVRSAEADLHEVRAIEGGLRAALAQAHDAGLELNLREIEYRRLSREQQNKSKLYEVILQRTTETDLTRMLNTAYARVVDRAQVPDSPVAPNRAANAVGGLLGGLLLGIMLAFGVRFLDRRIRSLEAIERLGLTVLGIIPKVVSQVEAVKGRRGGEHPEELAVHDTPMSAAAERYRGLRTNLAFTDGGGGIGRSFLVTGSLPKEGKTTVALNLAASIAQSGKRVLIVDTDLRKPRIHSALGLSRTVGVTSFLVGDKSLPSVIQETRVPNLFAITSGPVPPNPAELLHGARFAELVQEGLDTFDTVVFDSPPLGAVTDAAVVAPQVDGVVLVIRASLTTRDVLKASVNQLTHVGAKVLGVVVNDLDPKQGSYYGQSEYYRQYQEYYQEDSVREAAE